MSTNPRLTRTVPLVALLILALVSLACNPLKSLTEGGEAAQVAATVAAMGDEFQDMATEVSSSIEEGAEATVEEETEPTEGAAAPSGNAARVIAALPAPPQGQPATPDTLPSDTYEPLKASFGLDGSEPMYTSAATPVEVQTFYRDELAKSGYVNPFFDMMMSEDLTAPYLDYFSDANGDAIRVVAGTFEGVDGILVIVGVLTDD